MELLPIFLNIRDRKCVVVGGGDIACRKAELLSRAGAEVHVIARSISERLTELSRSQNTTTSEQDFQPACIEGACLVVAATNDRSVNQRVSDTARELGIPVNVVDQPELCSFIMPSIVDRSPIVVAISSTATSPVLTRKIKELNETMLPERMGEFAHILGSFRSKVKDRFSDFGARIRFWEELLDSEIPELVYGGNSELAIERIASSLELQNENPKTGEVYLVGAGPGDPDLLTLRALRLMHKADVVLYDRLVSSGIMARLRPDSEKIHVGKARAEHSIEQETINQMLVRLAQEGNKVLRLKGGDPFIFGRGGEELEALAREGIPFQIVPGVTAASGCASYAGIPLTHRDYAQSVRFLTGHLKEGSLDLDWPSLVREQETLVFYMGLMGLETICEKLIEYGMDSQMPIAVIQQGTTATQKTHTATLQSMPALAKQEQPQAPTIIIVGKVVDLRQKLNWFQE